MPNGSAYARTFMKYNKPLPHDMAVTTGNDSSVAATPNVSDSEYLSSVSIDGQILALNFDTE